MRTPSLLVIAGICPALWGAAAAVPARASAQEEPASARPISLEEAFALADRNNPDLAVAAENVAQARIDVRRAWAAFLPQATAQGSYLWYDKEVSFDIEPVPGTVYSFTLQESPAWQGQVTATWPLFNPEGFPTLSAARLGAEASAAAREAGRQELLLGVAHAWWGIAVGDRLVAAAEEGLANAAELVRISNEQVKARVATELALLRARAAEEESRRFLLSARGARGSAEAGLRRLTGVEGPIAIVRTESADVVLPADDAALWEAARAKRPDLRAAEAAASAAKSMQRAAVASYLPVIAGQATGYYTSTEGLGGANEGGSAGFVAQWNLLDGGLREARLARAASERREAAARLESARAAAREEITRTTLELRTAVGARDAAREGAALARRAQALAQAQYKAGTATNLEVTQANAALLQAQAALAQGEAQAALAALALRKALGEPLR